MGRWILIVLLGFATLGFGAASLCGGFFTFASLPEVLSGKNGYAGAALVIGGPSLLIGGGLCWLSVRLLQRVWRSAPSPAPETTETTETHDELTP